MTTIRAFHIRRNYLQSGLSCLDTSQRSFYFLLSLQRWLNTVLDIAIAVIAVLVICLTVMNTQSTSSAKIGVALNLVLIANTTLLRFVESWTSLEISIGSVARLRDIQMQLQSEDEFTEQLDISNYWPSKGHLRLANLRARHR